MLWDPQTFLSNPQSNLFFFLQCSHLFFSSICSFSSWEHTILNFHKTVVKSQFICPSLYSNRQNWWWSQISVHMIHKLSEAGRSQGLLHIVGDVNSSYFTKESSVLAMPFRSFCFLARTVHSHCLLNLCCLPSPVTHWAMCTWTLQSPCLDCCSKISTWLICTLSFWYHHSHITQSKYICQPYVKLQPTLSWTIPDLPKPNQLVFFNTDDFFLMNCVISSTWQSMFLYQPARPSSPREQKKLSVFTPKCTQRRKGWQRMRWLNGIRVNGLEFEQTPGNSEGQRSLLCYSHL